jgi:hypothetical protein
MAMTSYTQATLKIAGVACPIQVEWGNGETGKKKRSIPFFSLPFSLLLICPFPLYLVVAE